MSKPFGIILVFASIILAGIAFFFYSKASSLRVTCDEARSRLESQQAVGTELAEKLKTAGLDYAARTKALEGQLTESQKDREDAEQRLSAAVAQINARVQADADAAKRAEVKKQEDEAAEARRQQVIVIAETKRKAAEAETEALRKAAKAKAPVLADVDAGMLFTGTQFVITNKNSYDWTKVKMHLNVGLLSSGYVLRVERLAAGETYTVGAAQFAKADGERFDPLTHKPQDFMIDCDQGVFTGGWK